MSDLANITFYKNVDLHKSNNYCIYFKDKYMTDNYFNTRVHTQIQSMYKRINDNSFTVEIAKEELYPCGYMSVFMNDRLYYCFIDEIEYVNPIVSKITYSIDYLQTFIYDIDFINAEITREHTDDTELNTVSENINFGDSYDLVSESRYSQKNNVMFCLIQSVDPLEDTGEFGDGFPSSSGMIPDSLYNYVIPFTNGGSDYFNYEFNFHYNFGLTEKEDIVPSLSLVLYQIRNQESLVGKVINIEILDYNPIVENITEKEGQFDVYFSKDSGDVQVLKGTGLNIFKVSPTPFEYKRKNYSISKLSGFPDYEFKKMYNYPFSYCRITDKKGQYFEIRNEYVEGNNINIIESGSLSSTVKSSRIIENYLGGSDLSVENGILTEMNSTIPIVDEYSASYLQANKNQKELKETFSIPNSYVVAGAQGAMNFMDSLSVVNPLAWGGAIVEGGIDQYNAYHESLQHYAQQRDINNTPSTIRTQGGAFDFEINSDLYGFYIQKYTMTPEYQKIVEDFFNKYGYANLRIGKPDLFTRKYWNFIKVTTVTFSCSCDNTEYNSIVSRLKNGVWFFHTYDIGNFNLRNGVV